MTDKIELLFMALIRIIEKSDMNEIQIMACHSTIACIKDYIKELEQHE